MSIELVMPSNHLILCHPLLFLPSIFTRIKVFSMSQSLHQVAEVLELQHQYFGLISVPSNLYVEALTPNMTLSGDRTFIELCGC